MSQRHDVSDIATSELYSLQIYPSDYFVAFNPTKSFVKWAAVAVKDLHNLPKGMESFSLEGGLYAIFHYKGSSHDKRIFQYIYEQWLPTSGYMLDDRPHFELLCKKYKNNDPQSEEHIYIPIKT